MQERLKLYPMKKLMISIYIYKHVKSSTGVEYWYGTPNVQYCPISMLDWYEKYFKLDSNRKIIQHFKYQDIGEKYIQSAIDL